MSKKYPRIGHSDRVPKHKHPKCKCGAPATHYVDIQWTYFRGDDSVVKACKEHKNNIDFLIGKQS